MNRRDFLLLRAGQPAVLSCEQLFMRYLDSQMDGTTAMLLTQLSEDLLEVDVLHLTDSSMFTIGALMTSVSSGMVGSSQRDTSCCVR